MSSVIVTGANGFVGSNVVRAVGSDAWGLVRRGRVVEGMRVREIDAWNEAALCRALEGADAVVHAASVVHRPGASREEYDRFNVEGTRALVDACATVGVRRLVVLSTIKVYGERPSGVITEETPVAPEGGYSSTKLEAERIAFDAGAKHRVAVAVLRLCPVYGRGDKGNVRTMIGAIARRRLVVPGRGETKKSLVHVTTVAEVARAAVSSEATGVYVVADRHAPSMRELADTIAAGLGMRRPPSMPVPALRAVASAIDTLLAFRRRAPRFRDLIEKSLIPTVCSPENAERTFGVSCHVDLAEKVRDEIAWLRESGALR